MTQTYEVLGKFDAAGDANKLLYAPLAAPLTYRHTRRYTLDFEGDPAAAEAFVRKVLVDGIAQDLHIGEGSALDGYRFALDYGMKPGALDLEKEAVVSCYHGMASPGFALKSLAITQRIYVFGDGDAPQDRFVRDIVNPAIHVHQVVAA